MNQLAARDLSLEWPAALYDTLKAEDATTQFARIYGRGKALNNLGVASALLIGGFAAEGGLGSTETVSRSLEPEETPGSALIITHKF